MLEQTRPDGHGRARGLVSGRQSGSRVDARTFAPPPELTGVVASYWTTAWNLEGQAPHVAEILADPCVTIAIEAGKSRIVGVATRLWRRELANSGRIRAAKIRAGAASLILGKPIADLTDRILPLRVRFEDAEALETAVLAPAEDEDGLARLSDWLAACVDRGGDPGAGEAMAAVAAIAGNPEITAAGQVATLCGVGERALQRLFRDHVGATPKWVIRRLRLQEAALRLERGEGASLARLAADLGYADQAHLARDFKSATGRSPKDFRRAVWS